MILDKMDYINKMNDLLNDTETYRETRNGFTLEKATEFTKEARTILSKTDKGKLLIGLLEEAPTPPRMKGLPKIHKPNIPMRPITSGIGSAPHRLARQLAKPLSQTLGSISTAHLKNSTDLIERLKSINFQKKKLASFDVKALFTNVPSEEALQATRRAIENISEEELPLNKDDYIKLISLCIGYNCFTFEGKEYVQHRGLAMGSPLSAVMASLFMENLEEDKLIPIMGRGSNWFRYVDDIIVVVPEKTNLENKRRRLNMVHERIQFTLEEEENETLPFLDTLVHRRGEDPRFSVYRKPTNRDDFIHYLSNHSEKTKSGVVIGFFLRAIRICSEEYLPDEMKYIIEAFLKLKYPVGLLHRLRKKAITISERTEKRKKAGNFIVVPTTRKGEEIAKQLSGVGVEIAFSSGKRIGDLVKTRYGTINQGGQRDPKSVVYKIPCDKCQLAYIGETSRGIKKRIQEHKNDLRHHRTSNSMALHAEKHDHLPNFGKAEVLHAGKKRRMRKLIEAAHITTEETTNHREGFITLAKTTASIVINSMRKDNPTNNGPLPPLPRTIPPS